MGFSLGFRLRAELLLAAIMVFSAAATAVFPTWIERVFGEDVDHFDGSGERTILIGLGACAGAMLALARLEWSRRPLS